MKMMIMMMDGTSSKRTSLPKKQQQQESGGTHHGRKKLLRIRSWEKGLKLLVFTNFQRITFLLVCIGLCLYYNLYLLRLVGKTEDLTWRDDATIAHHQLIQPTTRTLATSSAIAASRLGGWNSRYDYHNHDGRELQEMEKALRSTYPGVTSCQRNPDGTYNPYNENCTTATSLLSDGVSSSQNNTSSSSTISSTTQILLYNPFNMSRIVCGYKMENHSTLIINDIKLKGLSPAKRTCLENPHPFFGLTNNTRLYSFVPSLATKSQLPAVEIWDPTRRHKPVPFEECDVNCACTPMHVSPRVIGGTNWTITWSMEGPQYYSSLKVDPQAHLMDDYYATTSFRSEIPLPYFSFVEYSTWQSAKPVNYNKVIKGAVFLARNCNSKNKREDVVRTLIGFQAKRHIRVDSVSGCLRNANPPRRVADPFHNKIGILRSYLFYLAFENQNEDDYITEKLWGAFMAGVVPVYLGGDNIHDHVPPHSIISVKDFKTVGELAKYLGKVAKNRTLYESYHEWRKKPLPTTFVTKYNITNTHSVCRTCRWANAKKYGLGWNHTTQQLMEPIISRQPHFECNVLMQPFRESWFSLKPPPPPKQSLLSKLTSQFKDLVVAAFGSGQQQPEIKPICEGSVNGTASTTSTMMIADGTMRRTLLSRDGVLDFHIEPTLSLLEQQQHAQHQDLSLQDDDGVVLQLETPILVVNGTEKESLMRQGTHEYWLQDERSRIIIVTSHDNVNVTVVMMKQKKEQEGNTTTTQGMQGQEEDEDEEGQGQQGGEDEEEEDNRLGKAVLRITILDPRIPLRIRLITEDINTFYENGSNEAQYFGTLMTQDFLNPIERFLVPTNVSSNSNSIVGNNADRTTTADEDDSDRNVNVIKTDPNRTVVKTLARFYGLGRESGSTQAAQQSDGARKETTSEKEEAGRRNHVTEPARRGSSSTLAAGKGDAAVESGRVNVVTEIDLNKGFDPRSASAAARPRSILTPTARNKKKGMTKNRRRRKQ